MASSNPPTDQRAGVRPIAFVMDNGGVIGKPVTLVVRPEDLTRNEPSRVTVHQTLGREVSGWADNFGEGLPSVTIAGHTGWGSGGRPDGVDTFAELNNLVAHQYHAAKQSAIDMGADPGMVKLLFVDMLDNFTWSVSPTQFVLRRSKSRPLLFQYNISLQAVSTAIDNPLVLAPVGGSVSAGLGALGSIIKTITGFIGKIKGMVSSALGFIKGIADTVHSFVSMANSVFSTVMGVISTVKDGISAVVNSVIGIARDIASVGTNIFRTFSAIRNIPSFLKAELGRVASAFNEVKCIFANSLKPAKIYEDYDGLYGASNCSSTTGGRFSSVYAGRNPFDAMSSAQSAPVSMTSAARSSAGVLARTDPVLTPIPPAEMNRHLIAVVNGVSA